MRPHQAPGYRITAANMVSRWDLIEDHGRASSTGGTVSQGTPEKGCSFDIKAVQVFPEAVTGMLGVEGGKAPLVLRSVKVDFGRHYLEIK